MHVPNKTPMMPGVYRLQERAFEVTKSAGKNIVFSVFRGSISGR